MKTVQRTRTTLTTLARRTLATVLAFLLAAMLLPATAITAFAAPGDPPAAPTAAPTTPTGIALQDTLNTLQAQYNTLNDAQKGTAAGQEAAAQIAALQTQIANYEAAAAETAALQAAAETAALEAAKYDEGTVDRTSSTIENRRWTTTVLFVTTYRVEATTTITYTVNGGGSAWRAKVGDSITVSSTQQGAAISALGGYNTAYTTAAAASTAAAEASALNSAQNLYYLAVAAESTVPGSKDTFYGSDYTAARSNAIAANAAAATAYEASSQQLTELEAAISTGLANVDTVLTDILNNRFSLTVTSGQVAQGAELYYSQRGVSKEATLSFDPLPSTGADFGDPTDYTWQASSTGDNILSELGVSGDVLRFSVKPNVIGVTEITVAATFNSIGAYAEVNVTPLVFTVHVVDTITFETDTLTASADSTNSDQYINLPNVVNAHGTVSYALAEGAETGEAWGRITLEGNRIKVAKEANAGAYEFTVTATDTSPAGTYIAQLPVTLTVANSYDAAYQAKLQELVDIQEQLEPLFAMLALLPEDQIDPTYLAALNAFKNITDPYEAMWNNGKPQISTEALNGLKDALNALGSVSPDYKSITDVAVSVLDPLGSLLSLVPQTKATMVNGYTIPYINITVPSLANLYVDAVTGVWDIFEGQVTPVTGLIEAYLALQDFVLNTDYASLKNLSAVNTYIQNLNQKYINLDKALIAFNESDSIFRDLADGILSSTADLLELAFGLWTDETNASIADSVAALVNAQVQNEQLRSLISDGLVTALNALRSVVGDSMTSLAAIDISLPALVGYSAKIRAALGEVAAVSAFAVGSYTYLKDLDLSDYNLLQLDMLDDYLTDLYNKYLANIDAAVGDTGDPDLEFAKALRKRVDDARARLLANDSVQTAIAVYNDIVDIYACVNETIAYLNSDEPAKKVEALLKDVAEKKAEVIDSLRAAKKTNPISQCVDNVVASVNNVVTNVNNAVTNAVTTVTESVKETVSTVKETVSNVTSAVKKATSWLFKW
jgi:hypothetical protein